MSASVLCVFLCSGYWRKLVNFECSFRGRTPGVIFKVQRGCWSPWASEPPDNPSWRTLLVNYVRRHAFPSFSRLLFLAAWLNDNARGRITCVTSVQSIPHRGKRVERRMGSGQERTYFHIITPWGRTFYPYCTCADRSALQTNSLQVSVLGRWGARLFGESGGKLRGGREVFLSSIPNETCYDQTNFDQVLKVLPTGASNKSETPSTKHNDFAIFMYLILDPTIF